MIKLIKHSVITTLAICIAMSFASCGNKQPKETKTTDSTATKDSIVTKKVEKPQVDSTKIFSDMVAKKGKMVYKVTRQVEDDIVYDDDRDLAPKQTFTESLSFTFNKSGKVKIKEAVQDDTSWNGDWEADGHNIVIYTEEFVLKPLASKDFKVLKISDDDAYKIGWTGSKTLKLQ